MAYEKINVNSLRIALNDIDNLNGKKLETLVNKMEISQWSGGAVNRIKTAINKNVSEINEIQKKINKYKTACDKIEIYQRIDDDIED